MAEKPGEVAPRGRPAAVEKAPSSPEVAGSRQYQASSLFAEAAASKAHYSAASRRFAWACAIFVVAQWAVGLVNVWLNVPLWTQIAHLLLADGAWLSLVLWFATALTRPVAVTGQTPLQPMGRPAGAD